MSNLQVKYVDIKSLAPRPTNPRAHSEDQVKQIARLIEYYGWTNPILVDENSSILAGHGRLAAAVSLNMKLVPVINIGGLTEAQKRAYVIADNKSAENAGWNEDILNLEFGQLQALDFDLSLTAFSLGEIGALFKTAGLTDPDEAPEAPAIPVSELGDVWLLGSHRLVCGDSTTVESVDKALNGVKPHLMVTDPPYGVDYDPDWRNRAIMI